MKKAHYILTLTFLLFLNGCSSSEYKLTKSIMESNSYDLGRVSDSIGGTLTFIKDTSVKGYKYIEKSIEDSNTQKEDSKEVVQETRNKKDILYYINTFLDTKHDKNGFNQEGINKVTNTKYDENGYNKFGYDKISYNNKNFHKNGYNKRTRNFCDVNGVRKDGTIGNCSKSSILNSNHI